MGNFIKAAYMVLKAEGTPLTAKEVTEKAISRELLVSVGLTPHQTMKSKLSTDILNKKDRSLFKRTSAGKFGLREWTSENEYFASRHKKPVFDEDILVFDRQKLSLFIGKEGFSRDINDIDVLIKKLTQVIFSTRRKDAEADSALIQLVSVFIVRFNGQILTHKRTKRLPESRLHDYYSIIFGGHLTKDDLLPLLNQIDVLREFSEELKFKQQPPHPKYRGLIYDSSRDVSKIHLGVVFNVDLTTDQYEIGERGYLMDPKFEAPSAIMSRIDEFENWSQILIRNENEIFN